MKPRPGVLWPPPVPDYVALSKVFPPEDHRPLAPVVVGPWPACPPCGRASGWKTSAADPTLRCLCGAPRPEPTPDPRCVRCRAPLDRPDDLLCPSCHPEPGFSEALRETGITAEPELSANET